jgi:hypothetical protein
VTANKISFAASFADAVRSALIVEWVPIRRTDPDATYTNSDGVSASSPSAFLRTFAFQSNATGGHKTTPTITPKPQHRPRVRAIATLERMGRCHFK